MLVFFVIIFVGNVFSDVPKSLIHTHIIPSTVDTRSCVESIADIVSDITAVIMIPGYHLAMLSLVKYKLPTFLKRIGAGLVQVFISSLLDLTLDTIGHTLTNSKQCMFDTSSVPANTLPISPYWLLIPDIVYSVGHLLALISAIETFIAQVPISLRGTATGIGIVMVLLAQSIRRRITV